MSIFKRLTATFSSRVDQMVSQIENHDAVVEVAIKESRQATAKAKVERLGGFWLEYQGSVI